MRDHSQQENAFKSDDEVKKVQLLTCGVALYIEFLMQYVCLMRIIW